MSRLGLGVALAAALVGGFSRALAESPEADVALILAIDVSGSVDDDRFNLQREGIADALDSDDFAQLLSGGAHQTIEIAVVEWAEEQRVTLPWTVIRGRADLAALANRVRHADRAWVHVMTDPAGGIAAADLLFATAPAPAERKVIDVSGDGRQNVGEIAAAEARDRAVAHDVTVNGLPITSGEDRHVDDWYRDNVIGGPGAFLVVADGYAAFAAAFKQKLALEVAARQRDRRFALARAPVEMR